MKDEPRDGGPSMFDRLGRPVPATAQDLPDSFKLGFERLVASRGYVVGLSALDAWIVLAFLQLALRHPRVGKGTRHHGERIARVLAKRVVQTSPAMAEWIAKGWDPDYDVVVPNSGGA